MAQRASGPSGSHLRPGRILVIDDGIFLGDDLRRTLADDNQVVCATEASEALARLQRGERYDVVLCDLMMPTMDGIDFHRRLSEILPDEAARVVFIADGAVTARVEAFCDRVPNLLLERPVDLDGLRALIERRIRGTRVRLVAGSA
jgi:CheY-like chemotaxis protein